MANRAYWVWGALALALIGYLGWGRLPWFYSTNYPELYSGSLYQLSAIHQVTQTFQARYPGLHQVDVHFMNQGRNDGQLTFHLRESCAGDDLVTQVVPEAAIGDNRDYSFQFSPIDDSAFKEYCLVLEVTATPPVEKLAVYASQTDIYPDGAAAYRGDDPTPPPPTAQPQFEPAYRVWLPAIFSHKSAANFDIGFNVFYAGPALATLQALLVNLAAYKTFPFGQPWFYPLIGLFYIVGVVFLVRAVWRMRDEPDN